MSEAIVEGVETLVDGLTLSEGPRWHNGRLYFSDIYAKRVCTLDAAGRFETLLTFDEDPSGLGFMPNGDLLIVLTGSARIMRLRKDGLALHADLSRLADSQINDMAVAPSGCAYVGQLGFDPSRPSDPRRPTALIRIDPDGAAEIVGSDLWSPNGIVLTPDGRTLVNAESGSNRLTAFDIDPKGRLANRRVFATLPGPHQGPDGICLDDGGGIWAGVPIDADAEGGRSPGFMRIEEGGRVTHRIPLTGMRRAIACVFGGANREWLYLCTTSDFMPWGSRPIEGGRIERVKITGIHGAGVP